VIILNSSITLSVLCGKDIKLSYYPVKSNQSIILLPCIFLCWRIHKSRMMREHNVTCCRPGCQTGFWIWHVTCFESDKPGIHIHFVFKSSYGQEIFLFTKSPRLALCPPNLPFNVYEGSFLCVRQLGCQVNHSLHLVQRLTTSAAIPTLPLYAIMEQSGKKPFLYLL